MENQKTSNLEFIALMASLMALASLSIDALLPGLDAIGKAVGTVDPQENQYIIFSIVLGLGIGQLFSGALSDSIGRKPVMYLGCIIFAGASLICIFSNSLELMLVGRLLQGVGLSGPRSVSIAMIRDKYAGNIMAKIMSYITVIFILAPIIAPTFGKFLMDLWGWESIFYSQLIFGIIVTLWLYTRQEETLVKKDRKKWNYTLFTQGIQVFFKAPSAVIYTVISGVISAPFLTYISASHQIFSDQYNLGEIYPYIFSALAGGIGLATFINGSLVMKYGMRKMAVYPMLVMGLTSLLYILLFGSQGNPSSSIFITFLAVILFSMGFVFGNINALAMQPLGRIAGIGSSINGFLSTLISVPLAALLGHYIQDSAIALFIGFFVFCVSSLVLIEISKRYDVKTT
ncbi:multidrug effflux MFS transporter [Flavobacteriaceae bacterium]|nr:multidrug effflux MFS transporter [Flavobacteriaceae bacterium]